MMQIFKCQNNLGGIESSVRFTERYKLDRPLVWACWGGSGTDGESDRQSTINIRD